MLFISLLRLRLEVLEKYILQNVAYPVVSHQIKDAYDV